MEPPGPELAARAAHLLGWAPEQWRAVHGGYTPAARFVASAGDRRAFVKVATTPVTAGMLRREALVYQRVTGAFMPDFLGWEDDPDAPMLVIEDLADASWPPPWDAPTLEAAVAAVRQMHATPADIPRFVDANPNAAGGWARVDANPAPFLSLGLVSPDWLQRALPTLAQASADCRLDGEALTHFDLRSDNMCLAGGAAKLIDWAAACVGDPDLDLGFWLPSLAFEGGPRPEAIIGHAPQVAAVVSGYFASNAGRPIIPDAPFVRRVQREQLSTALPWAARALGLPPPA